MKVIFLLCILMWRLEVVATQDEEVKTTPKPKVLLDKAIKARLFAGLESQWRMPCNDAKEKEFYKKIEDVDARGLEKIINAPDFTSGSIRICNRFGGLICGQFYIKNPSGPGKAEYRCLCTQETWWGGVDHPYCSVPITRPCGTWMRVRTTYTVETKFSNLNEYLNCTKDAYCAGRGFCICQRGKKCNTNVTGTVKEDIEKELQEYFSGVAKNKDKYRGKFLRAGENCDPQNLIYREGEEESRGIDYPRLREYLESDTVDPAQTRRICDPLNFYVCRRGICQCRLGFKRHNISEEYQCKALQTVICDQRAWKESNWYNVGLTDCYSSKEHCVLTTDKLNSICCPKFLLPETTFRCPRNDCDTLANYTYFMTFVLGILLLAHVLPY